MGIRIIDAMRKIDILRGLSDPELLRVADLCRAVRVPAGKVIFKEGDEGNEMYIIHEGRVRVVINSSRHDGSVASSTINILHANQCFGELIILNSGLRAATVIAVEQTTLIVLGATQFRKLCQSHPHIGYCIIYNLAQDLTTNLRTATLLLHGTVRLEAAAVGSNGTVEAAIDEYSHVLVNRDNEIKNLVEQNQLLDQQKRDIEGVLRQHQRIIASMEAEIRQVSELMQSLETQKHELEMQLRQHLQAVAAMDAEIKHITEQKQGAETQRREIDHQLRHTQRELAVKETEVVQALDHARSLERQIGALNEQLRQQQDDADYLNAVITGYRERERQRNRFPWAQ